MSWRRGLGRLLYLISVRCGGFLDRHPALYWLLLLTWGCLESLAGCFVAVAMLMSGHRPYKNHRGWYFMAGDDWGGFSVGFIQVVANNMGESWTRHTIAHECGHSHQDALFGPLWLLLAALPSQIRWCIDRWQYRHGRPRTIDYDDFWAEKAATDLGEKICGL